MTNTEDRLDGRPTVGSPKSALEALRKVGNPVLREACSLEARFLERQLRAPPL